jgi:hypothetical protein
MGQLVFNATLGGTTALVGPNTAATNSLTIPNASGALAWSTSALTSGRVTYAGTGGLLQDSANFVFDGTNVGIGAASPSFGLTVVRDNGSGYVAGFRATTGSPMLTIQTTSGITQIQGLNSALSATANIAMQVSGGNVGIGIANPVYKLVVSSSGAEGFEFIPANSAGRNLIQNYNRTTSAYVALEAVASEFTWQIAGAEKMRIDTSGNLLVGETSASGKITVVAGADEAVWAKNTAAGASTMLLWNNASSGDNIFMSFLTDAGASTRGTISYNRGAGLTAYNTTSDYRAKDIISPVLDSGEVIDSVPVYMGKMKGATQARPMFIAHETPSYAHTGEKDAVDEDGNPVYQQMDASSLVPVLWAEIQSLRKRVATLEAK